jgi:hypothetical protein
VLVGKRWETSMGPQLGLIVAVAASAVFALSAGTAVAQDLPGIQTPSHNIFCMASPAMQDQPAEMRCDIRQMSNRPLPTPASCPESWGDAFFVDQAGPGKLMCHGDTVANPSYPVLDYGRTWSVYGFTCLSQTTGLTCRNGQGHGFSISREEQKLF